RTGGTGRIGRWAAYSRRRRRGRSIALPAFETLSGGISMRLLIATLTLAFAGCYSPTHGTDTADLLTSVHGGGSDVSTGDGGDFSTGGGGDFSTGGGSDFSTGGGSDLACMDPTGFGGRGCYTCTPTTREQLLNACTTSTCMPYDNSKIGVDGG